MSLANQEQLQAIRHRGGVLLNAGAGAGKTFVLVEHIRYLVEKFFEENSTIKNEILLKSKLSEYLSKIVLMTFTNEAALELRSRVFRRFKNETTYPMSIVEDCLIFLNISTIHGFCLKLITDGFVVGAPSEIELYDEEKIGLKIEKLVTLWMMEQVDTPENRLLFKNLHSINDSMKKIFLTPELRVEWSESEKLSFEEKEYFKQVLIAKGLWEFWQVPFPIEQFQDSSHTKWYELINEINALKGKTISWQLFSSFLDIYKKYPRVMPPKIDEVKEEISGLKELRDFFEDHREDFEHFFNYRKENDEWYKKLKSLFDFIDSRYYQSPGISFSDLEFLVRTSLVKEKSLQDEVAKRYHYIIVDEYQDTSLIQYEILKLACKSDFTKIFCVGDQKQAIYGFRGGELSVFTNTARQIPLVLSLKNNYRSEEKIVSFNNDFFSYLLPIGKDYENLDINQIEVEAQNFPETKTKDSGEIKRSEVVVTNSNLEKLSSDDLNMIEAEEIANIIVSRLEESKEIVCILYRNLGPSQKLINLLIERNIPFEAQVKIPLEEDPIFILFAKFVDALVELDKKFKNDKGSLLVENKRVQEVHNYFQFMVENVLRHFSLNVAIFDINDLIRFYLNVELLGLDHIFSSLLAQLGISNSMYRENQQKITDIITVNSSSIHQVWEYLRKILPEKYSTKFYFGIEARVKIMTTHASKGLQFDHVILGGIHTNGRFVPNLDFIGKLPGAFKWTNDLHRKKLFSSPAFIYEKIIDGQKEFSESKRLFYVACTRAIKTINWCDISFLEKMQTSTKGAWVNALRKFEYKKIINKKVQLEMNQSTDSSAPIYFKDSLGLNVGRSKKLGIISEVSVSKLATLAVCPRKFYLSQILKLDDQWQSFAIEEKIEMPIRLGLSDAKRGSRIHKLIENYLLGKNSDVSIEDKDAFEWICRNLDKVKTLQFQSEAEMKFSIFGQMMTGIPDLVIECNDGVLEIWDYKSGIIDSDDMNKYFFQLKCYAFGLCQIRSIPDSAIVRLKIMALDQKEIFSQELTYNSCKQSIFETWLKLNDFSTKKINHCKQCEYGNLCH